MSDLLTDFRKRSRLLNSVQYHEATERIAAFLCWMEQQDEIEPILRQIDLCSIHHLVENANQRNPIKTATLEKQIACGLWIMRQCEYDKKNMFNLAQQLGIRPSIGSNDVQNYVDEIMNSYVHPTIEDIEGKLEEIDSVNKLSISLSSTVEESGYPLMLTESLQRFWKDNPDLKRSAFLMMKFGNTPAHEKIVAAIKHTLKQFGITVHRADDKQYHDDLFPNVLTYIYGCRFGIAVFERLESDEFNPNVSLEVGYMQGLHKSICLLKDQTLPKLNTDLAGKLYQSFDPQDPEKSIPCVLTKWLEDKEIISK